MVFILNHPRNPDEELTLHLVEGPEKYICIRESSDAYHNLAIINYKYGCIDFKAQKANTMQRNILDELKAQNVNVEEHPSWKRADKLGRTRYTGGTSWQGSIEFGSFDEAVIFLSKYFRLAAHPNNNKYTDDWLMSIEEKRLTLQSQHSIFENQTNNSLLNTYMPSFFNWCHSGGQTYKSTEFKKSQLIGARSLPVTPGCYVWKYNGETLYVGKSSDIRSRLGGHLYLNISGPKSNAIFATTGRDAVLKYLLKDRDIDIEKYRDWSSIQKKNDPEYMSIWDELHVIIENSTFIVYSTKDETEMNMLERRLILELNPIANNGIPKDPKVRNDLEVLGFIPNN